MGKVTLPLNSLHVANINCSFESGKKFCLVQISHATCLNLNCSSSLVNIPAPIQPYCKHTNISRSLPRINHNKNHDRNTETTPPIHHPSHLTMSQNHHPKTAIEEVARRARAASRQLLSVTPTERDAALSAMHDHLHEARSSILSANLEDKTVAKQRLSSAQITPALYKRLDLSGNKFDILLTGINSVRSLPDPVAACTLSRQIDDGLQLFRVACPIGVVCVIFEARPEAAVQIASLAVKSANAVILKGGREAEKSNAALVIAIRAALLSVEFPIDAVQLVATREEVRELLGQSRYIDLIIPRGSNKLVKYISENTRIPVMGHADGICSVYVDASADAKQARDIVIDAKAQYPAVCNAAETMLIHKHAVTTVLPVIGAGLAAAGVEVRADAASKAVLKSVSGLTVVNSTEQDYDTEFLELTLAVKVVESLEEAIEHINEHGSGHTDCIVTEDEAAANKFLAMVDSAGVYHNASTRFADGYRLGFGAEVGVSTHRTHARGPVGLEGLMIYKYQLRGKGHVVKPYVDGDKKLKHKDTPEKLPPS